jgi:hypothetical protein
MSDYTMTAKEIENAIADQHCNDGCRCYGECGKCKDTSCENHPHTICKVACGDCISTTCGWSPNKQKEGY